MLNLCLIKYTKTEYLYTICSFYCKMIDKKNLAILRVLDSNARQANSKIAKFAGLSKEVVNYRISKMEKENILTSYFGVVDIFKIGNNLFKLLVKFQKVGENKEQEIVEWLKKRQEVAWLGNCDGSWNLIITFSAKNIKQLTEFTNEFNFKFGKYFQEKQLLISSEVVFFNEKYLSDNNTDYYRYLMETKEEISILDSKDKIILFELSKNARIPSVELSKKVNLTAEGVAKRIKKLIKDKIILGFKPRINFGSLGLKYLHLFVSVKDTSKIDDLMDYYKHHKNCIATMRYSGVYDFHLELVVNSDQELRDFLIEFREKFGENLVDYQILNIYNEHHILLAPSL